MWSFLLLLGKSHQKTPCILSTKNSITTKFTHGPFFLSVFCFSGNLMSKFTQNIGVILGIRTPKGKMPKGDLWWPAEISNPKNDFSIHGSTKTYFACFVCFELPNLNSNILYFYGKSSWSRFFYKNLSTSKCHRKNESYEFYSNRSKKFCFVNCGKEIEKI